MLVGHGYRLSELDDLDCDKAIRLAKRALIDKQLGQMITYLELFGLTQKKDKKLNVVYPDNWLPSHKRKQKSFVAHFDISDLITTKGDNK